MVAVAGHPSDTGVFYFGAVAGGIWKTDDAGAYWHNVSDGYLTSSSIGALAVSEADPNVIYAGTGESTIRTDVSVGDGVYRSSDAGRNWQHVGLTDSHHIGEVRIHPRDPDLVYVAALGHAFGPNEERGVYRSRDGGGSWERVLYLSDQTGAVDLCLDPTNPRIVYATTWQVRRSFWHLSSGGPECGLYRSDDGGDSWTDLSDTPGFPSGMKGKIGVSASAAQAGRLWAIVEAEEGGLYRSDDYGAHWQLSSGSRELWTRPWYYCHVFADPTHADTVFITNLKMWRSTDGGSSFAEVTTPHGDNHDLWIDPADSRRMVQGNDGGATVTLNGGKTWSSIYNQLTAQFYRIDVDDRFPYRVYATQQDNSSICVPSGTDVGAINWSDCEAVGTGESGFVAVDPKDDNLVYVGAVGSSPGGSGVLQRCDRRSGEIRLVSVWPEDYLGRAPAELRYRFAWTYPIVFSRHDTELLYVGGNHLFGSRDGGHSWQQMSPDLTRNDPDKLQASGGPITRDVSGAEHYCTLSSVAESVDEPGVIWAASDDGLVHVSHDGADSWQAVTPPDLPEWSYIACIEPDPHQPGGAYLCANRFKLDDYAPYLFKTDDYGASWRSVSGDLATTAPGAGAPAPAGAATTRGLRVDPVQPGLLFVGTETGVWVSFDDGERWRELRGNLPVAPVYDLRIKGEDLVVATHGRSFWVLDDISPLRALAAEGAPTGAATTSLLPPRASYRVRQNWTSAGVGGGLKNYMLGIGSDSTFYRDTDRPAHDQKVFPAAGTNPPEGAIIHYQLAEADCADARLVIVDEEGREVARIEPEKVSAAEKAADGEETDDDTTQRMPAAPGLNRFVWNLRYPDATKPDKELAPDAPPTLGESEPSANGPVAPPGRYQVRLESGELADTQSLEIRRDPRIAASDEDLQRQFEAWRSVCEQLSRISELLDSIRRLRRQLTGWQTTLDDPATPAAEAAKRLAEELDSREQALQAGKAGDLGNRLSEPGSLTEQLNTLLSVIAAADAAPNAAAEEMFELLRARLDEETETWRQLNVGQIAELSAMLVEAGIPPLGG